MRQSRSREVDRSTGREEARDDLRPIIHHPSFADSRRLRSIAVPEGETEEGQEAHALVDRAAVVR